MTPKILDQYREAHLQLEKQKIKQADFLNHVLGRYLTIGFNEPKKYPETPYLSSVETPTEMTDEDMERQARRNTIRMGGTIK